MRCLHLDQFWRCYRFATTRREQHAGDLLAGFLQLLRHRVGVLIERKARRVMAGECLRDLRVDTRLNERRHEEVAQHVKGASDARLLQQRRPNASAPVVIVDRLPGGPREHELARRAQTVELQLPQQLLREWDAPAAVGGLELRPGAVRELAGDADNALLEVDLLPLEAGDFAEAEARACRCANQERGGLIGRVGDGGHLGRGKRPYLHLVPRLAHILAGVCRYPLEATGVLEERAEELHAVERGLRAQATAE